MADKRADPAATEQAAEAMNLVLAAEREAEQAIAECERRAAAIIADAHRHANRIADRVDERITLIKMRCSQRVAHEIGEMERAEHAARARATLELDESHLDECITVVSAALTEGPGT